MNWQEYMKACCDAHDRMAWRMFVGRLLAALHGDGGSSSVKPYEGD